jgi:hypothetical protein
VAHGGIPIGAPERAAARVAALAHVAEQSNSVPVTDLEYVGAPNSLYAAKFGRGIFSLALPP